MKDLEKALGINVTDDLKAGNYTVEDIYGYYAIFSLDNFNLIEDKKSWKSSDNEWKNVLLVMKKTDKWWKQIWKIWESMEKVCWKKYWSVQVVGWNGWRKLFYGILC